MSGGPRGPVPARSEERRRRNKVEGLERGQSGTPDGVEAPAAHEEWHPIARDWYVSLTQSGQAYWYEASDWATAVYVAQAMSESLYADRMSAHMFAAVLTAATELLATEGSRRRLRLELTREPADEGPSAGVTALADYKRALGG